MEFRTKHMMCVGRGGIGGGVFSMFVCNGAGPTSLVNLMAESRPIQSTPGWDHGIFACLGARCECVCVDVRLFVWRFEFRKSTINLD
jgi:hypothetical protein